MKCSVHSILALFAGNRARGVLEYMMANDQGKGRETDFDKLIRDTEDYSNLDLNSLNGFRQFVEGKIGKCSHDSGGSGDENSSKDMAPRQGASSSEDGTASQKTGIQEEGDHDEHNMYDFNHTRRGLAVIINNETFNSAGGFRDRPGSSCDAAALYHSFNRLGFDILPFKDLSAWKMTVVLEAAAAIYDHENADCFACAILSHGTLSKRQFEKKGKKMWEHLDLLFGVDGRAVPTKDVTSLFNDENCPKLEEKPRLFFLQACRGNKLDPGQEIRVTRPRFKHGSPEGSSVDPPRAGDHTDAEPVSEEDFQETGDANTVFPTPLFKDFLVMYATPPGFFAFRRDTGAWFIQSLCRVIDGDIVRRCSFINVLARVCGEMARDYQSDMPDVPYMHEKKSVPVVESMLVKDIVFTHKVRR